MSDPRANETALLRTVLGYLEVHRIFHFRTNSGAMRSRYKGKTRFVRFGVKGLPDIIAVMGGFFVGIELKSGKNEQTSAQFEFQSNLEAAKGFYILAYSLDDVIAGLDHVRATIRIIRHGGATLEAILNASKP